MQYPMLVLQFLFKPLTDRVKLGEGGIALLNTAHVWFATKDATLTLGSTLISLLTLCALYGYNDYTDRERDKINPKKDQRFVGLINQYNKLFLGVVGILTFTLTAFSYFYMGDRYGAAMLLLFIINTLYSARLKSMPWADIFIVTAWGGVFILIVPQQNLYLATIAGVMTGIAHVYQMLTDAETDRETNVKTTIASYPKSDWIAIGGLTLILAGALYAASYDIFIAISAILPLLFYFVVKQVSIAWFLSRGYFAVMWLLLLYKVYGGF